MREVAVIGGGPGGYAAALAMAQAGARVHLVEEAEVGGTCLHRGCIPTKTLLETARVAREIRRAGEFGLGAQDLVVDFPAVRARQQRTVQRLAGGLGQLLRSAGVTVLRGRGRLVPQAGSSLRVVVSGADGGELAPDAIVLAPGSRPAWPALPGLDQPGVLDSDRLLADPELPPRLAIIGGGAIGCEFATAYSALGARVTLLEALPGLLPGADPEIARRLEAALRRQGVAVHTGVRVLEVAPGPVVRAQGPQGELTVPVERVLVATGRRPCTDDLGLEEAGIGRHPGGAIVVDAEMRCPETSGVWALGDAVGGPGLAHAAFQQAGRVVAGILGVPLPTLSPVPHPVYTAPEVAWVGWDEARARQAGHQPEVARIPFAALGRAHAAGDTDGLCKVVAAGGRVVGVHLIGSHATELIGAAAVVVSSGLSLEDLGRISLPHPTLVESLGEAAELLLGHPRHVAQMKTGS